MGRTVYNLCHNKVRPQYSVVDSTARNNWATCMSSPQSVFGAHFLFLMSLKQINRITAIGYNHDIHQTPDGSVAQNHLEKALLGIVCYTLKMLCRCLNEPSQHLTSANQIDSRRAGPVSRGEERKSTRAVLYSSFNEMYSSDIMFLDC